MALVFLTVVVLGILAKQRAPDLPRQKPKMKIAPRLSRQKPEEEKVGWPVRPTLSWKFRNLLANWLLNNVRLENSLRARGGMSFGENTILIQKKLEVISFTEGSGAAINARGDIGFEGPDGFASTSGLPLIFTGDTTGGTGGVDAVRTMSKFIFESGGVLLNYGSVADGGVVFRSGTDLVSGVDNVDIFLKDGSVGATGAFDMNSQQINELGAPTLDNDAARLIDVQSSIAGLSWKDAVKKASTIDLTSESFGAGGVTYANGALGVGATITQDNPAVDGVFGPLDTIACIAGDRILIKDQSPNEFENGIYEITTLGDGIAIPWVLTRATDSDTSSEIDSAAVFVQQGSVHADQAFTQTDDAPTMGAGSLTWVQFGGGVTAHGALTGLGADDHSTYNNKDGRPGGQEQDGGTAPGQAYSVFANNGAAPGFSGQTLWGESTITHGNSSATPTILPGANGEGQIGQSLAEGDGSDIKWDKVIAQVGSFGDLRFVNGWSWVEDTPYDASNEEKAAAKDGMRLYDNEGNEMFRVAKDGLYFKGQKIAS